MKQACNMYTHACMKIHLFILRSTWLKEDKIASWNVDLKAQGQIDRKIIWTQ